MNDKPQRIYATSKQREVNGDEERTSEDTRPESELMNLHHINNMTNMKKGIYIFKYSHKIRISQ